MDIKVYLILFGAIAAAVTGTMLLPLTNSFTKTVPSVFVICSYGVSFYLPSVSVHKIPLAVVYASWSGLGIFTIALLGTLFLNQPLNWQTVLGLFCILIGVVLVNIYKSSPVT